MPHEECVGADNKAARSHLKQVREDSVEVAFGACMEDVKAQPEGARRCQHMIGERSGVGIGGIDEKAMLVALGTNRVEAEAASARVPCSGPSEQLIVLDVSSVRDIETARRLA